MLPAWAIVAIIKWGPRILSMDVSRPGPAGKVYDYIKDKIKENYDPSYTPPPGMPDENGNGEYPDASTSPVKPPMPDYTPSTDPNNPPDKNPPNKPYTPPSGMPNYDPSDPNKPKEPPIPPRDPSKPPFPPDYPWDKDLPPDPPVDPLVLDLDGDGIKTIAIDNNRYFDADGDGFATSTAWINNKDGFLVMDRNSDGTINNGTELFGDQTILQNGKKAQNGFEALKELDENRDGKIDEKDSAWKNLNVWIDANSNGVTDEGELHTLEEVNVKSLLTGWQSGSTPLIWSNVFKTH